MRSALRSTSRACKQPDDKSESRQDKDEYDPEDPGACRDAALGNIDYRPYVGYQDEQSEKTAKSEHDDPPLVLDYC